MFTFTDFCDWLGWTIKWILVIGILLTLICFLVGFLVQYIEKASWGDYEYIVRIEDQIFLTHDFVVDEYCCVHFIDNYENHQLICEKYIVGEYFLYSNNPNLKSIWFGY